MLLLLLLLLLLSVCLSVCLYLCISVCMSVCIDYRCVSLPCESVQQSRSIKVSLLLFFTFVDEYCFIFCRVCIFIKALCTNMRLWHYINHLRNYFSYFVIVVLWFGVGLVIERSLVRLPAGALSSQLGQLRLYSPVSL